MKRSHEPAAPTADRIFHAACLVAMCLPLVLLASLVTSAAIDASPAFIEGSGDNLPARAALRATLTSALAASARLVALTLAIATPLGVGAALWLEEYAPPGKLKKLVEQSTRLFAGVPPIIAGLFGLSIFAPLFGPHAIAAAATLTIVILPTVITTSRDALRAVPRALREASFALGADRGKALRHVVLPMALPGIVTGLVGSLARAAGETAPLLALGAVAKGALPALLFGWISAPSGNTPHIAAGILVLLAVVLSLHGAAAFLRLRFERRPR